MERKKEWNANEWEEYLKTIESPQTELLLDDPELVEAMSEEQFKVENCIELNHPFA